MMNLKNWLIEGKIKKHTTSPDEINKLLRIVDRDLKDARITALSADRRFITAYNAALQLSTVVLRASGFRTNSQKSGHHWMTFIALPELLGKDFQEYSDYFNTCRVKRNTSDYTCCDEVSDFEAKELVMEVEKFKDLVIQWLNLKNAVETGL